jgi:hypothetical protein
MDPDGPEALDYRIRFNHAHWLGLVQICSEHVGVQFEGVMAKYNDPKSLVGDNLLHFMTYD